MEASNSLVLEPSIAQPKDAIEAAQNHFVMRDDDDRGAADIRSLRTGVVNQQSKQREYNNRASYNIYSVVPSEQEKHLH